jgi:predicted Zn-dependent protease
MEEDLALLSAQHASELEADNGDARLEEHYDGLTTVADGKVQQEVINRRQGMGIRASVNGA